MTTKLFDHRRLTVLFVSSAGGVLNDLLALEPWWRNHAPVWALVTATDTRSISVPGAKFYFQECRLNTPLRILHYFFAASRLLRRVRPDIVVTAGTGVALPFFLAAFVHRFPRIWIETYNIVAAPGLASQIGTLLASHVIIQRESLRRVYPRSTFIGELY